MKKFVFVLLFIMSDFILHSQNANDIFTSKTLTWYGLDFSKTVIIGGASEFGSFTINSSDVKNKYFQGWNDLFITDPKKFNLKKTFKKDDIYTDLNAVGKINSNADDSKIFGTTPVSLTKDDIQKMVNELDIQPKDGIGLCFIIETFNKIKGNEYASMWVTFFDIKTKKVLLTNRMQGKSGGIGLKSYWANAIYKVLNDIEDKEYKKWKNEIVK